MSVRKLLILCAAGVAALNAASAVAGGPELPPVPFFEPRIYLEGNVGYAGINWERFSATPFDTITQPIRHNSTGGFAGFGSLGFQFTRFLALEGGGGSLPSVRGLVDVSPNDEPVEESLRVSSWFAYAAGRITVPLYQNLDVFGKAGGVYRRLSYSGPAKSDITEAGLPPFHDSSYWAPIFAIGFKYQFTNNFSANIQYNRIPGRDIGPAMNTSKVAPAANIYTGGLGVEFAV